MRGELKSQRKKTNTAGDGIRTQVNKVAIGELPNQLLALMYLADTTSMVQMVKPVKQRSIQPFCRFAFGSIRFQRAKFVEDLLLT